MSPVFDTFDDDLDDLTERCASPDAGVRRVAMMELAEAVRPRGEVLLLKGLAATRMPPSVPPPPRRWTSTMARMSSRAGALAGGCRRGRAPHGRRYPRREEGTGPAASS